MDFEAPEEVEKKAAVAALNVDELQQLGVTTKKAAELTTKLTKQNVKVLDALKELVTMGGGSCGKIGDVKGKLLFEFAQAGGRSHPPSLFSTLRLNLFGFRNARCWMEFRRIHLPRWWRWSARVVSSRSSRLPSFSCALVLRSYFLARLPRP